MNLNQSLKKLKIDQLMDLDGLKMLRHLKLT